jgi:hypothetical protein
VTATTNLRLITGRVRNDEPCFMLAELHLQSPGYKGFHRYQLLTVVRDDRLVEFRRDLGPALKFQGVDQFRVPGGVHLPNGKLAVEHTVGELIEIANEMRSRAPMWKQLPRTDLVRLYHEAQQQRRNTHGG